VEKETKLDEEQDDTKCIDLKIEDQTEVDVTETNSVCSSVTPEPRKNCEFSDTDSAFSSVSSINLLETKASDNKFYNSQICWGCFSKSGWYPCIVYPATSESFNETIVQGDTRNVI
jgi:hypothetical protein